MPRLAAQVDAVVLVPGFGAAVRGWFLSEDESLLSVGLRGEDGEFFSTTCDLDLVYPRPDVLAHYAVPEGTYPTPGFTVLIEFPGSTTLRPDSLILDFGAQEPVQLPVAPDRIFQVGVNISPDTLLKTLRRLEESTLWPEFRRAVVDAVARHGGEAEALLLSPSPSALFITVPDIPSDQLLFLEQVKETEFQGCGLVALCRPEAYGRSFSNGLVAVAQQMEVQLSVILIRDPRQAILTVPSIARELGCERLAFVGYEVFATADTLTVLATRITRQMTEISAFPIFDADQTKSAYCYSAVAGDTGALTRLIGKIPLRLGYTPYALVSEFEQEKGPLLFALSTQRQTPIADLFETGVARDLVIP